MQPKCAEANAVPIRCAVREVRLAQNEDQEVHEVEGNAVPPRCAGKEVRLPQNEEEPDVHEVVDVPLEAPYAEYWQRVSSLFFHITLLQ